MDPDLLEQTRHAYDLVAADYAAMLPDTRFEAPLDLAMIDHFVEQLPEHAHVLDAGCGAGRMLTHLAQRRADLVLHGVDLSEAMVAQARTRGIANNLSVADIAHLPHADASLDGLLCWYTIIHTEPRDLAAIAHEFRRVVTDNGMVVLGFQSGNSRREIHHAYGHDVNLTAFLHDTEGVAATFREAGFFVDTIMERAPRRQERHSQGFVVARASARP